MTNYMLDGKVMIIYLIVGLVKKRYCYIKISYFPPYSHGKNEIEVELDFSNYAKEFDLRKATGADTSQFTKKDDLVNLKSKIDKLNIDKLFELDVDKLKTVPTGLSKIWDVVKWCCYKERC